MSRGLGKEKKTEIILAILQKTKEPYTLPDLEKVASAQGVGINLIDLFVGFCSHDLVQQSVKGILEELCNDTAQVQSDRIGPTMYYWSFNVSQSAKV
jgi:hypothetical protein